MATSVAVKRVDDDYTLELGVELLLCDSSTKDFTVTWPAELIGRQVVFKKLGALHQVTIQVPAMIYDNGDNGIHLDDDKEVLRMSFDGVTLFCI